MEKTYSFDKEKLANFLARIGSEIAKGKLTIEGEEINIPEKMDVEYEFKSENSKNEIEIEIKWKE